MLSCSDDYAAAGRFDTADAFEAPAGSHGIGEQRIKRYVLKGTVAELENSLVHIFETSGDLIKAPFLRHHPARAVGIQFISSFGVQP